MGAGEISPLDHMLSRLEGLHPRKIDLSLDRIEILLRRLGDPHLALPPVIHIAGTNGKGSTAAFLRAMAEQAGLRVHVYTSPHLVRFNERIRLAGALVTDDALIAALDRCMQALRGGPITFFEITTAAAFLLFAEYPADLLILETGLGGRFDATNVLDRPALTIITNIALDHREFLGDDLSSIAREKAGIMRAHVPVIFGPQPPEAELVLLEEATRLRAPFFGTGRDWTICPRPDGLLYSDDVRIALLPRPALVGRHQLDNAGLAAAAGLRLDSPKLPMHAIAAGIASAFWPARMQKLETGPLGSLAAARGAELWLDGAHNPHAAAALGVTLMDLQAADPRALVLITGLLDTKDAAGFFSGLTGLAPKILTVSVPGSARAIPAEHLAVHAHRAGLVAQAFPDFATAVRAALAAESSPLRIVICGSLYLAGAVLAQEGPPD